LLYTDGNGASELELKASQGAYLVGRANICDVQLTVNGVSRKHAELRYEPAGGRWTITDLGSSNGTWVNGSRLPGGVLSHGDQILIGEAQLLFDDTRQSRAAGPPPVPSAAQPPPQRRAPHGRTESTRMDSMASSATAGMAEELERTRRALLEMSARHDEAVAAAAGAQAMRTQLAETEHMLRSATEEAERSRSNGAAIESLRSRLREANTEAEDQRARADALLHERSELAQRLLNVESEFEDQAAELARSWAARKEADARHEAAQERTRATAPIEAVEIDALKRRINELTSVQDSLRAERDELMEQVSELQVDRGRAQLRLQELTETTANSHSDSEELREAHGVLEKTRERLESVVADRDQLATQVRSLRATIDAMPDPRSLVSINERLAHAENELARRPLPGQLEDAARQLNERDQALHAQQQELEQLRTSLQKAVGALNEVHSGAQQASKGLAELREAVETRVGRLLELSRQTSWPLPDLLQELGEHMDAASGDD
jgi:chromosome segregation ATPase